MARAHSEIPHKRVLNSARELWPLLFIAVIIAGVFAPTLRFDFVNLDDPLHVAENVLIRSLSLSHIVDWFRTPIVKLYIPIPLASFALDYQIFGTDPFGYHLTQLILHILNTFLVYVFFRALLKDTWSAFLGAILFGIHPVHSETVAWISERKSLVSAFFVLMFMNVYHLYHHRRTGGKTPGVLLGLFILAVLSRPTAVVLPLGALGYDFFVLKKTLFKKKGSFYLWGLVSVIAVVATVSLYPGMALPSSADQIGQLLVKQLIAVAAYAKMMIYPVDLHLINPVITSVLRQDACKLVLGAAVSGSLIWGLLRCIRLRTPQGFFVWWVVLSALPIVTLFIVPVASHQLYLLVMGAIGMLMHGLKRNRRLLLVGALSLCVFWVPAARASMRPWKDSLALWTHVLAYEPDSFVGHLELGNAYEGMGRAEEAIDQYRMAIRKDAFRRQGYVNLANMLIMRHELKEARVVMDLLKANVHHVEEDLLFLKASMHAAKKGERIEAMTALSRVLDKDPDNARALTLYGIVKLRGKSHPVEARFYFEKALRVNPNLPVARFYLGMTYSLAEDFETAIRIFKEMEDDGLMHDGLYYHLAYAELKLNRMDLARHYYQKSVQLQPDHAESYLHLGLMSFNDGNLAQAGSYFESAYRLSPETERYRMWRDKLNAMEIDRDDKTGAL